MRPTAALAWWTVACATLFGGCVKSPAPVVVAPVRGCDLADRTWRQTSSGPCPESTWRFTRRADGRYAAAETGCSGATGVAKWDGVKVTLDFQYPEGAGHYVWPLDADCKPGPGEVSWSAGPVVGPSASSTLSPAP
jgi:hypothetical protein